MSNNKGKREEPGVILERLAKHASRYSVNLDGFVSKVRVARARGGFAIVWSGTLRLQEAKAVVNGLANNGFLGNGEIVKVAIKSAHSSFPGDEDTIKKFLEEVHTWSKLDHPNVLPLIGITTQFDLTVSIVSPWMENGNARDFVHTEFVDPCPLIQGIARGLCYMHNLDRPLYHRDVKGSNVLVSENGQALLTDFGLSFLTNSSFSLSTAKKGGGSIPWVALEILNDDCVKPSAAGDVWSFAMTVLELFTREDPFYPVQGPMPTMLRILKGPPGRPSAKSTCFRMTDEWWSICSQCWNTDPFLRPTMVEITDKIQKIMTSPCISIPNGAINGSANLL